MENDKSYNTNSMNSTQNNQSTQRTQSINRMIGNSILKAGILIYILGFVFLFFVGQNYTGFWSFIAPFSIVLGIILISVGLIK